MTEDSKQLNDLKLSRRTMRAFYLAPSSEALSEKNANELRKMAEESGDETLFLVASNLQLRNQDKKWIFSLKNYLRHKLGKVFKVQEKLIIIQDLVASDFYELELIYKEKNDKGFKEQFLDYCLEDLRGDVGQLLNISAVSIIENYDSEEEFKSLLFGRIEKDIIVKVKNYFKNELEGMVSGVYCGQTIERSELLNKKSFDKLLGALRYGSVVRKAVLTKVLEKRNLIRTKVFGQSALEGNDSRDKIMQMIQLSYIIKEIAALDKDLVSEKLASIDILRYSAYQRDGRPEVENFLHRIEYIIKKYRLGKKELYINRGYLYEHLALISTENKDKVKYLGYAEHNFCLAKSPRSYLAKLIKSVFLIKLLAQDDLKKAALKAGELLNLSAILTSLRYYEVPDAINFIKTISFYGDCSENAQKILAELNTPLSLAIDARNDLSSDLMKHNQLLSLIINNIDRLILTLVDEENALFYIGEATGLYDLAEIKKKLAEITETKDNENKGSFELCIDTLVKNDIRGNNQKLHEKLKHTVAAFLNTGGGGINIGVIEKDKYPSLPTCINKIEYGDFWIIGIEQEQKSYDILSRKIESFLIKCFGDSVVCQYIDFKPIKVTDSITILRIVIKDTKKYNFFSDGEYFIRQNASIGKLGKEEAVKYISSKLSA